MTSINLKTNQNVAFFILPENGFSIKNDTFYSLNIDSLDKQDLEEILNGLNFNILIGADPDTAGTKAILQDAMQPFISINKISEFDILDPTDGQVLSFIDGKWKNHTIDFSGNGGGSTVDGVGFEGVVETYSNLPAANSSLNKFYFVKNSEGTKWLPGSLGGTYRKSGTYFSTGSEWITDVSPFQATQLTVDSGINNDQFITPLTFEQAHKWTTKAPLNESNVVDISYGGTGASNKEEAFKNLAPDQFGNSGAVLTTDGLSAQWSIELNGGNF